MNHQDLKTTIEELNPNLTPVERISETVAALSQTEGSFKENVASMEKLFTEKIGYKKEDNSSQAKIQRHHDKFAAGIAKSNPFLKMTDKMTPDKLKEMLSENGIQTIRQVMLSQAVSIAGKPKAPAKEVEAELSTAKNMPQA